MIYFPTCGFLTQKIQYNKLYRRRLIDIPTYYIYIYMCTWNVISKVAGVITGRAAAQFSIQICCDNLSLLYQIKSAVNSTVAAVH